MQSDKNTLYTITYSGKCADGHGKEEVQERFAQLFGVAIDDVEGIFTGRDLFIKENLNRYTAIQYKDAFTKIGAECIFSEQARNEIHAEHQDMVSEAMNTTDPALEPKKDHVPDVLTCPKCGHRQEQKEECEACGIFFSKFEKVQERKKQEKTQAVKERFDTVKDGDVNYEGAKEEPDTRKARFSLQAGTILLLCVFIFDGLVYKRGLDIGVMPYILVNFFYVYGGFLISRLKGYPVLVGLLGCFSLFGISVLILLPDRTAVEQPYKLDRGKTVAIMMMIMSVLWGGNYLLQWRSSINSMNHLFEARQELKTDRSVYPSYLLDSSPEAFDAEIQEMKMFIDEGFTILEKCRFRTNTIEKIAGSMFEELASLFIWIKYQQFLHAMEYEDLPDHLYEDNIDCIKLDFKEQIDDLVEKCGGFAKNPGIAKAYGAWVHGSPKWDFTAGGAFEFGTKHSKRLNRVLFAIWEKITERNMIISMNERSSYKYKVPDIANPPEDIVAETIRKDNVLEYRLADNIGEMSGRLLVMAYFLRPYKRFGELKYYGEFVCIGGDLPNIYMHSNFSVFHGWSLLGTLGCVK